MFSTEKILAAFEQRTGLLREETDAVRIVDGEGDDLPGLLIDNFAGRWLVQAREAKSRPAFARALDYRSLYWKTLIKEPSQSPVYLAGEPVTQPFEIVENGLKYSVDFQAGYSQGIFLDQRDNRRHLRTAAIGNRVLNTFAYTCAFGVSAAAGGGSTVNLDLSRHYLEWGKRNYALNGIDVQSHEFIYGDVFYWLKRFRRRSQTFDVIVLDPPTFSRDRKSNIFRVEDDYGKLLELALPCLALPGSIVCCTNSHRISQAGLESILRRAAGRPFNMTARAMPADFTGSQYLKTVWLEF
jgi:23S rRNA (cytosine1962-C5)-methyltransferase